MKTVIDGLDPERWRRLGTEATDRAIRTRSLPKDGDEFESVADEGTELTLYYRHPMIDTFYPVMR